LALDGGYQARAKVFGSVHRNGHSNAIPRKDMVAAIYTGENPAGGF
jgi:hypothetical protein